MRPVIFALPGNEEMAWRIAKHLKGRLGSAESRRFPDGESYVRITTPVAGRAVILVCTLDHPDEKFLPLSFLANTARELGAARVGLICPYLAYMRQDKRFRSGEGLTSRYFAAALGQSFDWLITVDPHLHRLKDLSEVYRIPAVAAHAAPLLSDWIREHVADPLLIGPDQESEQWVASVAAGAGAPYTILRKTRLGDRNVRVSQPGADGRHRTPVLIDDIVSTAQTMIETVKHLRRARYKRPVCLAVHAIFADDAYARLKRAGAGMIITCNTIAHPSNCIDVSAMLCQAARRELGPASGGVAPGRRSAKQIPSQQGEGYGV
jgi:ribose-phosphate pyrophosphokinase